MSPRVFVLLCLGLLSLAVSPAGPVRAADEDAGAFRFSVLGDNRPPGGREDVVTQPEEFLQTIREVNFLRPDLAWILGDLIMGYDADPANVAKQWDAFDEAIAGFEMPVRLVAGNHDVWDAKSRETYRKKYGPSHYSLLHRGCRFIALNSEDIDHPERIAGPQLEWLAAELAKGGARRTFVFLHKPFWRYEAGLSNWMEDVHPLLVKAGVDAVFAGHWHHYERSNDRDGVKYYVTGGAGAEIGENPYAGDFHHHLIVEVPAKDEDPIEVRVLKTGFLVPDTIVREDERETSYRLGISLLPEGIPVTEGKDADAVVAVRAKNPWSAPLLIRHELDPDEKSGWSMEPARSALLLGPGEETVIRLRFRSKAADLLPGPPVRVTGTRDGQTVVKNSGWVPIRFARDLEIAAANGAIQVDGKLDEEAWASAADAGRFLGTDGQSWAKLGTTFRVCRDETAIYLSFRCEQPGADSLVGTLTDRDWRMLTEDCVIFYLDPDRDGQSRYCFGATAHGVRIDYRAPGGAVDQAWNPDWDLAVARDAKGWTLEAGIPFDLIGGVPKTHSVIGVNAIRRTTAGEGEMTGWSIPAGGRLRTRRGSGPPY